MKEELNVLACYKLLMTNFCVLVVTFKINFNCLAHKISLRSKRFQSSYCAKVRAEAKKKVLSSQRSRRTRAETLATQASIKSLVQPCCCCCFCLFIYFFANWLMKFLPENRSKNFPKSEMIAKMERKGKSHT